MFRRSTLDADVIVAGGGPGGSTAATLLARRGWKVVLLERDHFPRAHVGESTLPASIPIFEALGVAEAVDNAGFVKKLGATMVWGSSREPWSWYFSETNQSYPHAYQVSRPKFDKILLDNAKTNGVDVREGHRVLSVDLEPSEGVEVSVASEGGDAGTLRARMFVDASGQAGLVGRQKGLRDIDPFFKNLAVYAYYDGVADLASPDEGNIFIESYADGWVWTIPLGDGSASVGAVVDAEYGQGALLDAGHEDAFLAAELAKTPLTAGRLGAAAKTTDATVVRDWSYTSRQLAGDNFVLVGDAACFVDPLFSSGVHLAMNSGVMASAYVTSMLNDPELGRAAATAYQELYMQQYTHFRELAALFYSSNRTADSYFWEARRISGDVAADSPRNAFIRTVAGQSPLGYERIVLERGEAPDVAERIAAVESERQARIAEFEELVRNGTVGEVVPILAEGAALERKPVLGDGEFEWSAVLTTRDRPAGLPLSNLIGHVVRLVDGETPVSGVIEGITKLVGVEKAQQAAGSTVAALQILYSDGAIASLGRPTEE